MIYSDFFCLDSIIALNTHHVTIWTPSHYDLSSHITWRSPEMQHKWSWQRANVAVTPEVTWISHLARSTVQPSGRGRLDAILRALFGATANAIGAAVQVLCTAATGQRSSRKTANGASKGEAETTHTCKLENPERRPVQQLKSMLLPFVQRHRHLRNIFITKVFQP